MAAGGNRKHKRNFRVKNSKDITVGSGTRYRNLHGIPAGSRKSNHEKKICPVHTLSS